MIWMRPAAPMVFLIIASACVTMEPAPSSMRNAPANVDPRVDGAASYPEMADRQAVYNKIAKQCAAQHGGSEWEIVREEQFEKHEEWTGQMQSHTRLYYDCLDDNAPPDGDEEPEVEPSPASGE